MPWITFLLLCKCNFLQLLLLINWNIPVLYWGNSWKSPGHKESRRVETSSTAQLPTACASSSYHAFFLPIPKALENICVPKSSPAGLCVSEAAPGQLGEIVHYHIEKEEQPVTGPWVLIQISFSDETPGLARKLRLLVIFVSALCCVCGCAVL